MPPPNDFSGRSFRNGFGLGHGAHSPIGRRDTPDFKGGRETVMQASRDWFGGTEKLCPNRCNYVVTLTLQAREWAKAKFGGDRH
jgi:hypothetical protein